MTPEVQKAINNKQAVVALESTIIAHGMPFPQNLETALEVEQIIRDEGAIPATVAIINGQLKAGLTKKEIEFIARRGPQVQKVSRRDIPFVLQAKGNGACTVASTMFIAAKMGIKIFATGGIGGVHHGYNKVLDISADLQELAHTNVVVVCSGAKAILDLPNTLEYLETHGVPVIGFKTDEFPAFYSRSSGLPLIYNFEKPEDIAELINIKWATGLDGGLVIANPIPTKYEMPKTQIDNYITQALRLAIENGITGKDISPFLLAKMEELTKGESLKSNIQLVYNNAMLAAQIARFL